VQSFKDRLDAVEGFGPGFDLTRLVLASGVVVWHSLVITSTEYGAKATPLWLFAYALVPMFFVLSGFLVTRSALRLPVREYLLNRGFRIVPALAVDIVVSALIIGPLVTTLSLADYARDPQFARYFLNIVGWVHYTLPGAFADARIPYLVNGSLWTVPFELRCYGVMALMVVFGLMHRARWTTLLAFGWLVTALLVIAFAVELPGIAGKLLSVAFLQEPSKLIPYFLIGSAIYLAQGRLPFNRWLAAASAAAVVAASLLLDGNDAWANPWLALLAAPPLAYLTIYAGLSRLPRPPSINHGDYSYGIYLYHFPVLQVIDHLHRFEQWWQLLAVAALPVLGLAMFSWHLVERPALRLRKRFSLVGARVAVQDEALATTTAPGLPKTPPRVRSQTPH